MNLLEQESLGWPMCIVCRYAGKKGTIWPREIESSPVDTGDDVPDGTTTFSMGSWRFYQKVEEVIATGTGGRLLRSGHRSGSFCYAHWVEMYADWVSVAANEVLLENAFYAHLERTEQ